MDACAKSDELVIFDMEAVALRSLSNGFVQFMLYWWGQIYIQHIGQMEAMNRPFFS